MVKNGVERRLVFISEGLSWELKGEGAVTVCPCYKDDIFPQKCSARTQIEGRKRGRKKVIFPKTLL